MLTLEEMRCLPTSHLMDLWACAEHRHEPRHGAVWKTAVRKHLTFLGKPPNQNCPLLEPEDPKDCCYMVSILQLRL